MGDSPHSPEPPSAEIRAAASRVHAVFAPPGAAQDMSRSLRFAGIQAARLLHDIADLLDADPTSEEGSARNLTYDSSELHTLACAVLAERPGSRDKIADDARIDAIVNEDGGYPAIYQAEVHLSHHASDSRGPTVVTLKHESVAIDDPSTYSRVGRWWSLTQAGEAASASPGNAAQVSLNSLLRQLAGVVADGLNDSAN